MVDEDDAVLNGLILTPLPKGWTATGVAALIKCLDDKGKETWSFRTSEHLSDEEVLGALVVRLEISKSALLDDYTILDDEVDND